MYFLSDRNFAPPTILFYSACYRHARWSRHLSNRGFFTRRSGLWCSATQRVNTEHIFSTPTTVAFWAHSWKTGKYSLWPIASIHPPDFAAFITVLFRSGWNQFNSCISVGDDTLDLGYPNISYTGHWDGDDQSIVTCDHTAPTVYAGMSAVYYNYDTLFRSRGY